MERRLPAITNNLDQIKSEPAVVTFAHHLKVHDEDVQQQYTFGFFDEQPDQQMQSIKQTNSSQNTNPRKQSTQAQGNENKLKAKQPKTSLNSERCYKFKDRVNVDSFNYEQILKFISNCKYNNRCNDDIFLTQFFDY